MKFRRNFAAWMAVVGLWIAAFAAPAPAEGAEEKSVRSDRVAATFSDVAYGEHVRQTMDVWLARSEKPAPLVIYFHGGGWAAEDKSNIDEHLGVRALLDAGISVAAVNYRLLKDANAEKIVPPVQWPLGDAVRAVQFLRSKAGEWHFDKTRFAATGVSAGGCTSLWLAMHDDMADPQSADPIARESTRLFCVAVKAPVVSLDPKQLREWIPNSIFSAHAFGFAEMSRANSFAPFLAARDSYLPEIRRYSPIEHASSDDPPVFMEFPVQDKPPIPGEAQTDPNHSAISGLMLERKLQALGVPVELRYRGDGRHGNVNVQEYLTRRLVGTPSIVGLWLMGQSLCDGSESLPLVTPTDTGWGNLAFKRGVRTWNYGDHAATPEGRAAEQFAFAPLTATINGGLGETMANGLADHSKAVDGAADQGRTKAEPPHYLVAMAGQGGRTIEELSPADESTDPRTPTAKQHGGGYYKTSLDDALRAREQARAEGRDFAIGALVWMQGEGNGGPTGGIVPSRWAAELARPAGQEWYRDRLIAYRQQWSRDLRAITGQTGEIPMFTYQTLGAAGEAQLMAADSDPYITLVGSHYMVASAINSRRGAGKYGDAIHLSADGERWFGEQVAKVIRRVTTQGEDWQPLRPRKAWIDPARTSVLMDFLVPRPPLVLDETFLPREQIESGNGFSSLCGFQIRNAAGAVTSLQAVEVESPTRIRIRLMSPLAAGTGYTVSCGLPYAGQLGAVTHIRSGPPVDGQPTTELVLQGDLRERLKPLLDEGAFYAANTLSGDAHAQAPVRGVDSENGTTVLRFENRELRNGVGFVVGQTLMALRPFPFGNLRDSDSEVAIYRFTDAGYGRRAGQSYPLWNWCVLFSGFPIVER
jgi:acetyl esterase/lipase